MIHATPRDWKLPPGDHSYRSPSGAGTHSHASSLLPAPGRRPDAFNTRRRTRKILVDEILVEADRLEDLGPPVTLQRGNVPSSRRPSEASVHGLLVILQRRLEREVAGMPRGTSPRCLDREVWNAPRLRRSRSTARNASTSRGSPDSTIRATCERVPPDQVMMHGRRASRLGWGVPWSNRDPKGSAEIPVLDRKRRAAAEPSRRHLQFFFAASSR